MGMLLFGPEERNRRWAEREAVLYGKMGMVCGSPAEYWEQEVLPEIALLKFEAWGNQNLSLAWRLRCMESSYLKLRDEARAVAHLPHARYAVRMESAGIGDVFFPQALRIQPDRPIPLSALREDFCTWAGEAAIAHGYAAQFFPSHLAEPPVSIKVRSCSPFRSWEAFTIEYPVAAAPGFRLSALPTLADAGISRRHASDLLEAYLERLLHRNRYFPAETI